MALLDSTELYCTLSHTWTTKRLTILHQSFEYVTPPFYAILYPRLSILGDTVGPVLIA